MSYLSDPIVIAMIGAIVLAVLYYLFAGQREVVVGDVADSLPSNSTEMGVEDQSEDLDQKDAGADFEMVERVESNVNKTDMNESQLALMTRKMLETHGTEDSNRVARVSRRIEMDSGTGMVSPNGLAIGIDPNDPDVQKTTQMATFKDLPEEEQEALRKMGMSDEMIANGVFTTTTYRKGGKV